MSSLIQQKRDSLEQFIREQMIGPNGCRGRFSYDATGEEEPFDGEIINTTPGSIYSTAILFPRKDETATSDSFETESNDSIEDGVVISTIGEEEDDEMSRTDSNEQSGDQGSDADDEDVYSLSRRFPNTVGISCCLAPTTNLNNSVKISFSGRYYTKVLRTDKQRVIVLIDSHKEEFEQFYANNPILNQYFSYADGQLRVRNIQKEFTNVKNALRTINMQCAAEIANVDGQLDPRYLSIREDYRFLLSYREVLFNKYLNALQRNKDENNNEYYSYLDPSDKEFVINQLNRIEMYETFMSYFDNLVDLYDHKGFGFWRSHDFKVTLDLSSIDFARNAHLFKQVYKPTDYPCLNNIYSVEIDTGVHIALSAWLQVTRNSKDLSDNNLYLKVLLVNDSDPFRESHRNYFSIVNEEVNKLCFFGVRIDIESDNILPYHADHTYSDVNKDEDKLNFLYRDILDYGVGHLCSVDWPKHKPVHHIWSEFLPTYETPDIEPVPRQKYGDYIEEDSAMVPAPYLQDNQCLQFKWLSIYSDASDAEIISELKKFVLYYRDWIAAAASKITDSKDKPFALENLSKCEADMKRMFSNIENILESTPENLYCFRLMNSAMFMQLWHNVPNNQKQIREEDPVINPKFYSNANDEIFAKGQHASWRPFQLAFILLNLDGIIQNPKDEGWKNRNELVDLVWFPTGGGKTEAYLGIIALSIIYRRRKFGEKGAGVAAIMRYTLRLLTTQQFQRAMRLILALEQIRRWPQYKLGDIPISIGLYVGSNSLPNSEKDLDDEAIAWNRREDGQNKSKIPMDRCPWCGSRLVYSPRKKVFQCSNENDTCTFIDEIPVRLCDEQIYKEPPTLLFGTVDKFAALAHKVSTNPRETNKDSRRIFGKGELKCLPPDLIIQDELHLLLGPLGSAVSLFECAVDQLCTRKDGTRPKIISSTATTRNTELQIRALYDRGVNIFPHNGVDYDDSFFAFYKRKKEGDEVNYVSKRKYMGIMPTGRTQMTTQMRLAAILFIHRAIFEAEHLNENDFEMVANNYYSIISYFNSLKEVGKTDALFYTEYTKYTRRLFKRVMRYGKLLECFYAMADLKESELSGRLSGSEVNEKFAEVSRDWSIKNRLPHSAVVNGQEQLVRGTTPPDYILATNMISVGLDVGRFNTIIMNSMPRNIAEYIQASSRVARNKIGFVLTLHNPYRSRDVSHFEKFREFHEKLYFYVEPISITPFSQKSIEKYLPLYLATIIRHSFRELADRNGAASIKGRDLKAQIVNKVSQYFDKRFARTSILDSTLEQGLLTEDLKEYIIHFVDEAVTQWNELANAYDNLVYSKNNRTLEPALFTTPSDYDETKNDSFWTVPQSLRIVEPEAVLHINVE